MAILKNYIEGNLTQLNKLKYGDTATIGNEPIVQKTIPTDIRQSGPSSNQVSKRIDDLKRIGTILTQKPGLKYLANETALNAAKVTPKSDPNKTVAGNIISGIGANLFNSVKIIGSTLAQVPLNGTGTHFVKGFAGKGKGTYMSGLDTAPHTLARQSGIVFNNIPIDAVNTGEETAGGKSIEGGILKNLQSTTQTSFSKEKEIYSGSIAPLFDPNKKIRKELRLGLGDIPVAEKGAKVPRRKTTDSTRKTSWEYSQDKVNMLAPVEGSKLDGLTGETARDLIKFRFKIITPDSSNVLYFRAYLNSLNDSFSGNWNTFNYAGRGENFHTYNTFGRSISLGFKIAAQTRWEMRPLYQKIIHLASATAPSYNQAGFMRGTLTEITVGDYIYEQPGFLSNVSYTWNQDYPWEIAMNNPEGKTDSTDLQELPMILDCQLSFTPIHNFVPKTGFDAFVTNGKALNNADGFFVRDGKIVDQPKSSEVGNYTEQQLQNAQDLLNQPGFSTLGRG